MSILDNMEISLDSMMRESGVSFGTSGARGLASAMTDRVCYAYALAFLEYCRAVYPGGSRLALAGDLRPSTGRILAAIATAAERDGWPVVNCGRIPSPAVALYGIAHTIPAIMVTGSHIPEDRNGIKFNHPRGEITKKDEDEIRARSVAVDDGLFDDAGMLKNPVALPPEDASAAREYEERYTEFFGPGALAGLRLAAYQHSAVGRDILVRVLKNLGAQVEPLGRSEAFIPVDTEAIRDEDRALARSWAGRGFDAIVSTDGDSDRPLLSDEKGEWLRGDVLGILAAHALKISRIATPVSCNTALEKSGLFEKTLRTRIGSPYVIQGMEMLCGQGATVAGYEANGGFLLQTEIGRDGKKLTALPTRDALLPVIAVLADARSRGCAVTGLLRGLPGRHTASDRVKNFPTELSREKIRLLEEPGSAEALFAPLAGRLFAIDQTDGLRMEFDSLDIIHLRPSGNAPELRCYIEAGSPRRAEELKDAVLAILQAWQE